MWFLILFLSTVFAATYKPHNRNDHIIVRTNSGLVRGHLASDGDYFAFLGIPYAAPPIGENRFKDPKPPLPWDGVYVANETVKCPQNGEGKEDCLIVNVFTPRQRVKKMSSVLVYIHGGAFYLGVGQNKGVEPLTKQNIVVVTLNYRLGVLGYLCLGVKDAPGNAGLKDQLAALRWVKDNIKNFGGDPDQVTLYGMSAGAASVEFHILSNKSVGLYQRAVLESGTSTAVWATDLNPVSTAKDLAAILGFNGEINNVYTLIDFFKQIPADKLSLATSNYANTLTDGRFGFAPCSEKKIDGVDAFITQVPFVILTTENYHKVQLIQAFNAEEGLFLRSTEYYANDYKDRMDANFTAFMPYDLNFDSETTKIANAQYIRHFYFGDDSIGNNIRQYLNYFGDSQILHAFLNSVEIHSKHNTVYLIEFAYRGNMGPHDGFYDNITLAAHGDMIKHAILDRPILTAEDALAVERVSQFLGNYIKFGNPTPTPTAQLPLLWPKTDPNNMPYLRLNTDLQLHEKPRTDMMIFWDRLYRDFRRRPAKTY